MSDDKSHQPWLPYILVPEWGKVRYIFVCVYICDVQDRRTLYIYYTHRKNKQGTIIYGIKYRSKEWDEIFVQKLWYWTKYTDGDILQI